MRKLIPFILLFIMAGCGTPTTPTSSGTVSATSTTTSAAPSGMNPQQLQAVVNEVSGVASSAVDVALSAWAKANGKIATEVAQQIKSDAESTILPYLNGGNLPTGELVMDFLKTNVGKDLPPIAQLGLQGAALILDQFVTVGAPMDSNTLVIIKAFVQALDDGATQYLASPPAIGTTMNPKNQSTLKALITSKGI